MRKILYLVPISTYACANKDTHDIPFFFVSSDFEKPGILNAWTVIKAGKIACTHLVCLYVTPRKREI